LIFGGSEEEQKNDVIKFEINTGNFSKVPIADEDE